MAALLWLLFWLLLLEAESKGGLGSVTDGEEEKGNRGQFLVFWLRAVGIIENGIRGLRVCKEGESVRPAGSVGFSPVSLCQDQGGNGKPKGKKAGLGSLWGGVVFG